MTEVSIDDMVSEMIEVPIDDMLGEHGRTVLHYVLNCLPPLDYKRGPWLAGGFVRRLVTGEPFERTDLDIWLHTDTPYSTIVALKRCLRDYKETEYLISGYLAKALGGVSVHIMIGKTKPSLHDVLNYFGLTVCCFGTDGVTLVMHEDALDHCQTKTLVPVSSKDVSEDLVNKYKSYGFSASSKLASVRMRQRGTSEEGAQE